MTEYTLAQVIDKFGRNHNLKFQFIGEGYRTDEGAIIALDKHYRVVNQEGEPILSNFSLGSKFRLLNESVSVKEALMALAEGKAIYCERNGDKHTYTHGDWDNPLLLDNTCMPVSVEELLYGKWFIEEGN